MTMPAQFVLPASALPAPARRTGRIDARRSGLPAAPLTADVPRSLAHWLCLAAVYLTIATSGVVFSEPAPVDVLTMGLLVLLPVVGLLHVTPSLALYLALWLVVGAGGLFSIAAMPAVDDPGLGKVVTFTAVSIYLSVASFTFAAFIAKAPRRHASLILSAWTLAAIIAATTALAGYVSAFPGAYDLFTKFGRAAGTFKDPNVFGPFLVGPIVYMLHLVVNRPLERALLPLAVAGVLALALLLSFSRGAWFVLAVAILAYGWLAYVTTPSRLAGERIVALLTIGIAILAGLVAIALQFDAVSGLMSERASLSQSYDYGPEGRFGGQAKAIDLIAHNPLGIGALVFGRVYHAEEAHNVYLSMLLNAGWLGGGVYWLLVLATIGYGFRHALQRLPSQPLFLVVYATFLAQALEGFIIDTDHWRHFYLLMGMVWGLMARPHDADT
ncbi:MAG: O-antigen ligase family protein [Hyphomicrobiaceae bacterium]|nr:O-antigen ligase family protein [Hyphomicrobiaceae bacterium]